ncbi:PQQ-dependent sugar dehydrogenase [Solirubrobacter sp. CPCC 204708]|uniref:PQQ-dependent sugar dehydrogenase n=1 Tax=Solirubrobacter deserti TaxID=2282478 RepID=A0ABT4RV23_9ACTN|nr:PQQ-dependent sugar dehydrogenase [Solirubrobacter deserti]MDA0142322.1 PQQ-dependent sugar dehydrogenase [Solirubrobacter deserti]
MGIAALGFFGALAGSAHAQNSPFPSQSEFQKVQLNDRPGEPMSLAVLPDGRVLHTARTGEVRIHNPRTGLNTLVINMADEEENPKGLYQHDEEGLQGIAIDPNFDENRWVYLYYSPKLNTPVDDPATGAAINEGNAPEDLTSPEERERLKKFQADAQTSYLLLSRFKFTGNELDVASEQEILRVPADRGLCCHVGGQIDFDYQGNLYLSTGDDTNPFFSAGYTPIDDRETRNPAFDARRTSGNTNDLRGKILKIRVLEDGSYIPSPGNLFRPGTPQTRPEIFAMGMRNPFRFAVNRKTGDVYVGDYSPDANVPLVGRGPAGHGRWMLIRQPGNYGWPFCVTPNDPYTDYDFTPDAEQSGEEFNCRATVNDSRHNTGLRRLPPVIQPDVWYSYPAGDSGLFPELFNQRGGDGIGPMGGPAYEFDADNRAENRWPRVFDGHPLFYEWSRDYVKVFQLNRPNGGQLRDIFHLFGPGGIEQDNPMDMEFGPDGALYSLEYGDGFFSENPEAQLARIDYVRRGEYTPVVKVSGTPTSALVPPLTVRFSSAGTNDPDGDRIAYAWDFDANGTVDSRVANPTFTYTQRGIYEATLRVTDTSGRSASSSVRIVVGNQAPIVELQVASTTPPFNFGDTVNYTVTIQDEQPVDCSRVTVAYILGHDQHGHPQTSTAGCSGQISIPIDEAHAGATNLRGVFVATYTDQPDGEEPQQGSDEVVLTPGQ